MVSPALAAIVVCFCSILTPVAPIPIPLPLTPNSDILENPSSLRIPTSQNLKNRDPTFGKSRADRDPSPFEFRKFDLKKTVSSSSDCSSSRTKLTPARGSQPLVRRTHSSNEQNKATAEKFFEALCLWRHKHWSYETEKVYTFDSIRNEYTKNGRINYIDIMLDKVALQSQSHESIQDTFHFDGNFTLTKMDRETYNRKVANRFFSQVLENNRLEAQKQNRPFYASFQDIKELYTAKNSRVLYKKIEIEASRINFPYKFDLDVQAKAANNARAIKNGNTAVSFCKALRRWYNKNDPTNPIATLSDGEIKDMFRVSGSRGVGNEKRIDFRRMEDEIRQRGLKDGNGAILKFDIPPS
ncbi:hypothetical protein H0H93_003736 [Arthromyces matolae]|nr:hypothetical protein H0H93_003736 [Arthromyces matolae]